MKEFIFKTPSLTDPLAGLDVGSGGPVPPVLVLEASNQGSTSTKFVSSTPEAAAMIRLAIRQTNPTWVAWMGFKGPSGVTAPPHPVLTATFGSAARRRKW